MRRVNWRTLFSRRRRAIRRADAARDRRDPARAAQLYGEIIARWQPQHGILVQYANALKDSGAHDDAEKAYLAALALKPEDADIFVQRGHLMKMRGDWASALDLYLEARRLDPALDAARMEIENMRHLTAPVRIESDLPHTAHNQELDTRPEAMLRRLIVEFSWRRG